MRVLVNFIALHGDGCRYALEMSEGLIANGVSVIAIVSKNMENITDWRKCKDLELYEVDGYTSATDFLPKLIKFFLKNGHEIKKIVIKKKIDYVYVPIQSFWTFFVEKVIGKHCLIYTMHDPIPHQKVDLININNSYCAKKADVIVLLSKEFNDYVNKRYSPKKIVNLQLGGPQYYVEKLNESNTLVQYRKDTINFVFHGTINPHKGLYVLAEAYKKLSKKYENITLSIIGSGNFELYSEAFAGLSNVTVINRWLKDDEVASVFNGPNVVAVLPYLTATQSGVVTLAILCRAVVIATDTGGLSEQITDGVTGYLAEAGNADSLFEKMELVILNKDILDNITENAFESLKGINGYSQAKLLLSEIEAFENTRG